MRFSPAAAHSTPESSSSESFSEPNSRHERRAASASLIVAPALAAGAPSATIYRKGRFPTLFDEQSNWASDMFLYFDLLEKNSNLVDISKYHNHILLTMMEAIMVLVNAVISEFEASIAAYCAIRSELRSVLIALLINALFCSMIAAF